MKSKRFTTALRTALYFIVFTSLMVACNNGQGMMYGSGRAMCMGTWNWIQILISFGIGFLLGSLIARRRM